jgi:hypothetical protein
MKKLIVAFIVVLLIGVVSYRACVNIRAKNEALSRKGCPRPRHAAPAAGDL